MGSSFILFIFLKTTTRQRKYRNNISNHNTIQSCFEQKVMPATHRVSGRGSRRCRVIVILYISSDSSRRIRCLLEFHLSEYNIIFLSFWNLLIGFYCDFKYINAYWPIFVCVVFLFLQLTLILYPILKIYFNFKFLKLIFLNLHFYLI